MTWTNRVETKTSEEGSISNNYLRGKGVNEGGGRGREREERKGGEDSDGRSWGFVRDKPSGLPASFSIPPCWWTCRVGQIRTLWTDSRQNLSLSLSLFLVSTTIEAVHAYPPDIRNEGTRGSGKPSYCNQATQSWYGERGTGRGGHTSVSR